MRFFIPKKIESQNSFQYSHWRKYQKYARQWEQAVGFILRRAPSSYPLAFRKIHIVSVRSRFLDVGNLIGGAKPLPDALKRLGWIVDDSTKWCEISYEQRKVTKGAPQTQGTIIEIE